MDYEFKKRSAQAREKVENIFEFEGCKVRLLFSYLIDYLRLRLDIPSLNKEKLPERSKSWN